MAELVQASQASSAEVASLQEENKRTSLSFPPAEMDSIRITVFCQIFAY